MRLDRRPLDVNFNGRTIVSGIRPIDPQRIELLDDAMVEVLRRKSPMERLQMVFAAERTMRLMLTAHLQSEHPEWTPEQISKEVARRRLIGTS
jgi:hypothetical protein